MKVALIGSLILLAACDNASWNGKQGGSEDQITTIVQLLPTCPTDIDEWNGKTISESGAAAFPIIADIGKTIIAKSAKAGVQFLKDRQAALNGTSSARDTEEFYASGSSLSAKYGCIVFARGEVGSKLADGPEDSYFTTARLGILRDDEIVSPNEKINLVKAPVVYAEFAVEYFGAPAAAYFLRLNFLDYRDTSAKNRGRQKSLAFSFDFGTPGDADADKVMVLFAKFTMSLPKVPYGTRWTKSDLVTQVSNVQRLPAGSAAEPVNLVPVSVLGTLAEAEDPSEFEKIMTSMLDESSDEIGGALGDAFKNWVMSHEKEAGAPE